MDDTNVDTILAEVARLRTTDPESIGEYVGTAFCDGGCKHSSYCLGDCAVVETYMQYMETPNDNTWDKFYSALKTILKGE